MNDLENVNVATYHFVGYGIRISRKYGVVYNVKGNKAFKIRLKNDKKYLIGTQKPTELLKAIIENQT